VLNKTLIALTAAIAFGSVSASFAVDPENKIGDRYPFLEMKSSAAPARMAAVRNRTTIVDRTTESWRVADLYLAVAEVPENHIGDRYPFLEQINKPTASSRFAGQYLVSRLARRVSSVFPFITEVPENRISDRYPFLEPIQVQRRTPGVATAGRHGAKIKG